MGRIEKLSTKDMSREDWLDARNRSIGGSDAASILGLNQYNSAYALWAEKTGKVVPEDISDKEAIRLGNDLEQYVAERFMEATGKRVQRTHFIWKNEAYPFAHANPDRIVVGENAGLECKTTSSWNIAQQLRAGNIPPHWYCQMVHYMMVTGAQRWYLGALVFGTGFFHFTVERDEGEIQALADAERHFWCGVENGIPPVLDGADATTEALKTIYRDSAPGKAVDLTAVGSNIQLYTEVCRRIKELEATKAEQENCIKEYMADAEKGTYGNVSVSWKSGTRKTFDKKAYEADHGKISENYYAVTNTRTFRVNVKN